MKTKLLVFLAVFSSFSAKADFHSTSPDIVCPQGQEVVSYDGPPCHGYACTIYYTCNWKKSLGAYVDSCAAILSPGVVVSVVFTQLHSPLTQEAQVSVTHQPALALEKVRTETRATPRGNVIIKSDGNTFQLKGIQQAKTPFSWVLSLKAPIQIQDVPVSCKAR